jgi:sigma-B regulation protein RsbU (phosphoserine phosphatase)
VNAFHPAAKYLPLTLHRGALLYCEDRLATPMTRTQRPSTVLYVLLFLWMLLGLAYYVAGTGALRETWFRGDRHGIAPFDIDDTGKLSVSADLSKKTGLASGDLLVTLNGLPYTGEAQHAELANRFRPGDPLTVTVRQADGRLRTVTVPLQRIDGPPWTPSIIATLGIVLAVPLLSLVVGGWTVAARPGDPNAWLVLVILTFPEIAFGNLQATFWPGFWRLLFSEWARLVTVIWFPALALFGLFFPERSRIDRRLPWLKWLILILELWCIAFYMRLSYVLLFDIGARAATAGLERFSDGLITSLEVGCVLLFLVAVVDKQRSASTADARRRLRVLMLGSCLSLGPAMAILIVFSLLGSTRSGPYFIVAVPFVALFPVVISYVLVVQRAMDIRVLLHMGTKYLMAKATLIVIEFAIFLFLVVYVAGNLLRGHQTAAGDALLAITALAFTISARFSNRFRGRVQTWIDRRFFRESYNAEVILSELSEHARNFTEKNPLIENVTRRVSEVLHVPQVAVWMRNSAEFTLQQTLGLDSPGPALLAGNSATVSNLARTNLPARVYRDRPDAWLVAAGADEISVLDRVNAEVLLPLPGRDRLMGVIALGPKKSEEPYTPTDLRLLQSVATQTGLALEVSELAHSLADEAARRARSDRELEIAHEVQERLFPQQTPAVTGMTLAGRCRPAHGVGGDYYDMIQLEGGCIALAIGDVSGKGIPAALLMASLRSCLRTMTLAGPKETAQLDLAALMQKMNQLVFEASAANRYATFFLAVCDPATRLLRYVNAGHNPPVLLRGGDRILLEATGCVVGLLQNVEFEERSVTLSPGDALITYTDGISEALNSEEEEWGEERMLEAATAAIPVCADEILRAIFTAADRFTGNAPQYDDMTLLVATIETTFVVSDA